MANDSPAIIIFDINGNNVGTILDGSIYRLQVESSITSGTVIGISPLSTGGLALDTTLTSRLPSVLGSGGGIKIDGSGAPLPISGSITSNQGGTWTVQQGTPPWSVSQNGSWTVLANQGTSPWISDVTDRGDRLLGVIYGSQGQQLKQTATNFNTQIEIAVGGTLIDPRTIRALTSSDIVTANAGSGNFTVVQSTASNLNTNVSGTVTSNIGTTNGLSLDTSLTNLSAKFGSLGQKNMAGSAPIVIASDQSVIPASLSSLPSLASGSNTIGKIDQGIAGVSAWLVDGSTVTQPISVIALPLPSGAATGAKQDISNTSLVSIDSKFGSLGQKVMASSAPVVIASDQSAVSVSVASLPLPSGAATSSNQTTLGNQTTKINDGTTTISIKAASTAAVGADTALVVAISPNNTIPISAVSLPLPIGAATLSAQTTTNTLLNGGLPAALGTNGGLKIDGSGTALPISGAVTVSGTITSNQGTSPWVTNVSQFGGNSVVTGAGTSGIGIPRVTISNDSNILITHSDTAPATANITAQDANSTTTTVANGQSLITGTPTANSTASFAFASGFESIKMQVTGTWTGTLAVEISLDGGTTWVANGLHQTGTAYTAGNFTSNFIGGLNVSGATNIRVRSTASWTGTATVKVIETINSNSIYIANAIRLQDAATQSIQSTIKAASTAAQATDTALVVAISPNNSIAVTGTTTVNQGTANTLANAWATKITDATNGPAAVKAASTAAVAADPALVVSLSPNSHIKATTQPLYGTNNQTITITVASLANSATVVRQSTAIDNTSNLYEDAVIFVKLKTGASGVSATGYINVYGYGTADGGTTYPEGISGADGAVTLASPSNLILLAQLTANANATTYSVFFSFCNNYGLAKLPAKWGVVVANVSGAALDSTGGNHVVIYQGINGQQV